MQDTRGDDFSSPYFFVPFGMPGKNQLWKRAPALRLLIPLIAGILLQWYAIVPLPFLWVGFIVTFISAAVYQLISVENKFRYKIINGVSINVLFICLGALITTHNDIRNHKKWFGNQYSEGDILILQLEEPLIEKTNSYKALALVKGLYKNNVIEKTDGYVIVYFKKDTALKRLGYGSQIITKNEIDLIRNAGNPGSFDYKNYSLYHGITHQVYLRANDYQLLPEKSQNGFFNFIFQSRSQIVAILKRFIHGEKEQGLAEALLIGYKEDLDKNLVQAYSNTGVVHVIAISGLHLGLIYWLLLGFTKPLSRKKFYWARFLIITGCLWLFTLLVGAQPSVLRSALMFTVIAMGTVLDKRTSIYNTLALSAFVLLCWNPFWLWDVGFQLSYAAVLSIVIFFRPIYNWFYTENKIVDFLWKLIAASIAAQILTLPISIYHFHQFPLLFLFTNLLAVPLSSGILIAEIALCIISFITPLAKVLGGVIQFFIYIMNTAIERFDQLPFSVWDGMSITIMQAALLTLFIAAISYWLLYKERKTLWTGLVFMLLFLIIRIQSFMEVTHQKKIVVYNVPKYSAIDIMSGRKNYFIGDTELIRNELLHNFHIKPSRIMHRLYADSVLHVNAISINGKTIMILRKSFQFPTIPNKTNIDLLILSKTPKLFISNLANAYSIKQIVIDGSVPKWKVLRWKKESDSLKIPCFDVSEKGAFVINL